MKVYASKYDYYGKIVSASHFSSVTEYVVDCTSLLFCLLNNNCVVFKLNIFDNVLPTMSY